MVNPVKQMCDVLFGQLIVLFLHFYFLLTAFCFLQGDKNLKKRRKSGPSISKENNPLTSKDPDAYGGQRFHCMKVFQEICLLGFGPKSPRT